jgi:hypothetical protein
VHQEELTTAALRGLHRRTLRPRCTSESRKPSRTLIVVTSDAWVAPNGRWQFHSPSSICLQHVVGNGVETVVVILKLAKDGQRHPSDARFAPASPSVDAALPLEPAVEKERRTPRPAEQHGVLAPLRTIGS